MQPSLNAMSTTHKRSPISADSRSWLLLDCPVSISSNPKRKRLRRSLLHFGTFFDQYRQNLALSGCWKLCFGDKLSIHKNNTILDRRESGEVWYLSIRNDSRDRGIQDCCSDGMCSIAQRDSNISCWYTDHEQSIIECLGSLVLCVDHLSGFC